MALKETDRQHLSAIFDAHFHHSSSGSSRSGASSRDSSLTRAGTDYPAQHSPTLYNTLRKQSSPAYLSADYAGRSSQFSTPSPGARNGPSSHFRDVHHRSQSVKYPSGHRAPAGTHRRPSQNTRHHLTLELEAFRPRGGSSAGEDDREPNGVYRLRNFAVTSKGVVTNRGDSYRTKSSSSSLSTPMGSYHSDHHSATHGYGAQMRNERLSVSSAYSTGAETSVSGETPSSGGNPRHKVLMSGAPGVGKTALTNQFLTSEYMNAYDLLLQGEFLFFRDVILFL